MSGSLRSARSPDTTTPHPLNTPTLTLVPNRYLYYLVRSHGFEAFIMGLIIANALLMATTHYGEPERMLTVVESINYAFTCVFILEAALKVGAWVGAGGCC